MRKNQGFTLIELIIVIVVLGILAVTAAPQFIDFSSDARTSSMKGLKGSLQGAAQTVYGRAAIDNKLDGTAGSPADVNGIDTVNGYPQASVAGIADAADLSTQDWTTTTGTGSGPDVDDPGEGVIAISLSDFETSGYDFSDPSASAAGTRCVVTYANAVDANTPPAITVDLEDC